MSETRDLLIEVGTEELPPVALLGLSEAFAANLERNLKEQGISYTGVESFCSPRRLAVLVRDVATRQPDQETLRRGPAVASAFDAGGKPTVAALGFARSCGVSIELLDRERTDKGEWLVFRRKVAGAETATLATGFAERALADLPIPKRMRWGDGEAEFVRPIHWVCLLFGDSPIPGRVLGVEAQGATRGHRFHHPEMIFLQRAGDYADRLREVGWVEPSFDRRRSMIRSQVEEIGREIGLTPDIDPALLDEVTALVEWPQAILGHFDEEFLAVPPEVLIETMRKNQKFFPLRQLDGTLAAQFIAIANIESRAPEEVRAGNERVIRPRFADAKFFWEQDLKQPLAGYFPRLESVVFQDRLGSVADKCRRVAVLAASLASRVREPSERVERAALLAKCDLVTTMVFEFPALQGIMGRYYAIQSGEDPCVSDAMDEQYRPRFSGDSLPASACGRLVGLADRLDTLVGIFGIGHRPTGTKDPYGLRRASIAILRILIETPVPLNLREILALAAQGFPADTLATQTVDSALEYVLGRLPGYYQERGIAADTVEAVLATGGVEPHSIDRRMRALEQFRLRPEASSLAAANKRIRNILSKGEHELPFIATPDPALFREPAEHQLWQRIHMVEEQIGPPLESQDFTAVLTQLGTLRGDVDAFFDQVMVMTEDVATRQNRQALLGRVLGLFLKIADVSRLHD